jgi:pheromone shutdown-related protein TraB
MSDNILTIVLDGREIKLIGTAHISRESINEVKRIIFDEKPDMVCVELDEGRYNTIARNENWQKLDLTKVFREGKGFLLIANLVLASFQRRLGNELGVKPGEEMIIAVNTAGELGLPFSLCDREVQTTLRRAWSRCGLWSKSKLLASLLASAFTTEKLSPQEIENLKNRNELDGMMSELANYLPTVKETLIDERDRYLASKIWTSVPAAENSGAAACKKIIAVIGAGHMQGIKSHLEKISSGVESSDISELDKIPSPGFLSKSVRFLIPAILIAFLVSGFIFSGIEKSVEMLLHWVLWNGSLAALGAIIALGHPFAIIISFLGAPFTSLTPFIGVGIISGLVQVTFHKPRVEDIQNISEEAVNLKGVYRNRITRALLVFFLSSLGSSIGTFVSFSDIAAMLAR